MSELLSIALFLASVVLYAWKAGRNTWWFAATLTVLGLFVVLNITLYASDYFTGDGINDAVLYTLTNSLTGAGIGKYILPGVGVAVALVAVFGALGWVLRRRRHHPHHVGYSLAALLLALASVDASPAFHQISELVKSQSREGDPDFAAYYKEPSKQIDNPQLNLVYIYGESLERSYFDNDAFPNLTPELGRIKAEAIDFSNTMQLPGTDYTIAGMVASQCGIPLFAPFEGNASASVSSFFPQNICLGDILKNSGYENYFVQGANLRFAGKDVFLKSHGFDHLYGAEELKTTVADPTYRNDWGFYDDTVLDETWKKFEELSQSGKRFSLFALTVDTHHPDGFISRTCERKRYDVDGKKNLSFSAVSCSQEHIAALIEKIKASPYFKNTVIVVSSDHLAMKNSAWDYLNKHDRSNLFFVLRGDKPQWMSDEQFDARFYDHASDLVTDVKEMFDFSVAGACYPEVHQEAASLSEDIANLKIKVDKGVDFLITQLFYDNETFFRFLDEARNAGITVPILPGLMPITSAGQVKNIIGMSGTKIPKELADAIEKYKDNPADLKKAGLDYSKRQMENLLAHGVDGIHLYSMNKVEIARAIYE